MWAVMSQYTSTVGDINRTCAYDVAPLVRRRGCLAIRIAGERRDAGARVEAGFARQRASLLMLTMIRAL